MRGSAMTEKVYSRQEWGEALEEVKGSYGKVYVPSKEGDFHVFKDLKEGAKADFSYGNTRMSAKAVVYPQSERMFEYRVGENILREAGKDYSEQAVVGIRPCDAGAFLVVKRNFDTEEYRDPWWVKRYESTTLVGFGCVEPCGSCFCSSVGGGPFSEKGLDVLVTECGEEYVVRGLTEKGEAFLSKAGGGREAEAEDLARAEEVAAEALGKVVSKVETDKLKEKVQTELFDAPFWEEVAFGCINCGTCTYVCPARLPLAQRVKELREVVRSLNEDMPLFAGRKKG